MTHKIKMMIAKHKSVLLYVIFGIITTAVNYLVYLPLYNFLTLPASICNVVAWFVAVIVAFLTNKPFVFNSHDWSLKTVSDELSKFLGMRIVSGLAETAIIFLTVDVLNWNGNLWKLITSALVITINYIASKFIVFDKNEKSSG